MKLQLKQMNKFLLFLTLFISGCSHVEPKPPVEPIKTHFIILTNGQRIESDSVAWRIEALAHGYNFIDGDKKIYLIEDDETVEIQRV